MASENTTRKPRKKPSVICEQCNTRPVMDRCRICEDCWYSTQRTMRDKPMWAEWENQNASE